MTSAIGGSGSANFFLNFETNAATAAEEMVAGFAPGIAELTKLIALMERYDTAAGRMPSAGAGAKAASGGAQASEVEAASNRLTGLQDKITADLQRTLAGLESVMTKFGSMETGVVQGVGKATAAVQGLMTEVTGMLERVNAASEATGKAATTATGRAAQPSATTAAHAGVQQVQIVPGQAPIPVRIVEQGGRGGHAPTKTATTATDDASKGVAAAGKSTSETAPVVVPPAGQATAALGELKQTLAQLTTAAAEAKKIADGQRRSTTTRREEATQPTATSSGSRNAPVNTPKPIGPTYVSPKQIGGGFENLDPAVQRALVGIRGTLNNPSTPTDFRNKALATAAAKFQADPYYGQIVDPAKVFRQSTGIIPEAYGTRGTPSEAFRSADRSFLRQFVAPRPANPTPTGRSSSSAAVPELTEEEKLEAAAHEAAVQAIIAETQGAERLRAAKLRLLDVTRQVSQLENKGVTVPSAVQARLASATNSVAAAQEERDRASRALAPKAPPTPSVSTGASDRLQSVLQETEGNNALRVALIAVFNAEEKLTGAQATAATAARDDISAVLELSAAYKALASAESSAQGVKDRQEKAAQPVAPAGPAGPAGLSAAFFGKQGLTAGLQRHAGLAVENTLTYGLVFTGIEKLREVIKDGLDAQNSFVRLQATLDANSISAGNLRNSILNISSATAQPIEQVIDAASHLAGAFNSVAEVEVGTKVAAQLANISQGTLNATEAGQGLVDVITAYGLSGTQSIQAVGDQIAMLHNMTGVNVKDITQGTTQIAQEAHEFGLTQPQASTLAAYVSRGTNETGEQSASQLSRMLGGLYNGNVQTTLVKAGVATDAQFKEGDIAGVFTNLISKYHSLQPVQQQMIASLLGQGIQARAFAAAMNLGAEGVKQMNGQLNDNNALNSLNDKYLMTVSGAVKELSEDFQNLGAQLQQIGAFDFIEVLAKSVDLLFKALDNTLGLVSRFAGNNEFTKWFMHLSTFALEAAAALKIFGGSAATALGGRGLIAPTAASVAARRAAMVQGLRGAELEAAAPLAYGRANLRTTSRALIGRGKPSAATRAGLSEEEYLLGNPAASRGRLSRFGTGTRNFFVGSGQVDNVERNALSAAIKTESTAVTEYITAQQAATAATTENTAAVTTTTAAIANLGAVAELTTGALGGKIGGRLAPVTDAARVGERTAVTDAEAAAAGGARPRPSPLPKSVRGYNEAAAAGGFGGPIGKAEAGSVAARAGIMSRPITGLLGGLAPIAGLAAAGTFLFEGYKSTQLAVAQNRALKADLNSLNSQKVDQVGTPTTTYAPVQPLSSSQFFQQTLFGNSTNVLGAAGNFLRNFSLPGIATNLFTGKGLLPTLQTGPSTASGNASLALNLKEINEAGKVRKAPNVTIGKLQDEDAKIQQEYKDKAEKISKMGGNNKASQDEIIREMENAHQMIIDANARTESILAARAGIDAALSPTQITGLANFQQGVAGLTQAEVQRNPGVIVDALKASNVPIGTPEFTNALKSVGIREVTQQAPSATAAAAGYGKLLSGILPGARVSVTGNAPGTINASELQDYLAQSKNTSDIGAALQQAIQANTPEALTQFGKTYGYNVTGSGETATLSGGGGGTLNTGRYTFDKTRKNTYGSRLDAAISNQQAVIDSSQAILNQSKLITYLDPNTGKEVTREVSADEASQNPTSAAGAAYSSEKYKHVATYAPGSEQYNNALQSALSGGQQQAQLIDQKAQSGFQFAQGAGTYAASIGNNGQAISDLASANAQMQKYMGTLGRDNPQYYQYLAQIHQNKQQIAALENSPQLNALLLDQASTNDAVRKANAALAIARLKLRTDLAAGADTATLGQDRSAIGGATVGTVQASQGVDAARNSVGIAKQRNTIKNAQAQYNETLRQQNLAANSATADAATYYHLQAQATQQLQALHDAIEAQTQSTYDVTDAMQKVRGDAVGAAETERGKALQAYRYAVQQFGKDSQQANQAWTAYVTAQGAVADAQLAVINANLDVAISQLQARGQSGDLEAAAKDQVQKIQNEMANFLKKGGSTNSAAYKQLQAQLATAQRNAFDVQLDQTLALLDFQQQTYKITSAQEVQALQSILKNKQLTLAEQQKITLQIKSLQDSIRQQLTQGGLNIPSGIVLPTAYDVRRSIGAGFSDSSASGAVGAGTGPSNVNSNNTTTVSIVANVGSAADADKLVSKVVDAINKQTGQQASATTSTPRLVPMG